VRPRILPGFAEYTPAQQIAHDQLVTTIRHVYARFGFAPIETPVIELTDVLLAKGGGDTEKQIFRIETEGEPRMLRFDLTVPTARYVAQHEKTLVFPFRRSQFGPVFRAERPQKGRRRAFYQADVDIIGTRSPVVDAEIPGIIYAVFSELGFNRFTIRVSNRKVLSGLCAAIGLADQSTGVLRAVDKVEKIGEDGVRTELEALGATPEACSQVLTFIRTSGSNAEILAALRALKVDSDLFREGVEELALVVELAGQWGVPEENLAVDLSIARGLDYYTGTVYETILDDYPSIGSVCSGGRYDDLCGYYTETDLPGVGVSIGVTRLFDKLMEVGVIKVGSATTSKVMVARLNDDVLPAAIGLVAAFRKSGIAAELYPEPVKIGRQLTYANRLGIPVTVVIGPTEAETGQVVLKIMETGEKLSASISDAPALLAGRLG
jgi:histidyl-tRNA synthetase